MPGLAAEADGLRLPLDQNREPRDEEAELSFAILGEDGEPVTDFDVEHTKRMHVVVARHDLTGFQHLHPEMSEDGTWSTPIVIPDAGPYRVFADFDHEGEDVVLGADLDVAGNGEAVSPSLAAGHGPDGRTDTRSRSTQPARARESNRSWPSRSRRTGSPSMSSPISAPTATSSHCARETSGYLHVHPVEDDRGHRGRSGS